MNNIWLNLEEIPAEILQIITNGIIGRNSSTIFEGIYEKIHEEIFERMPAEIPEGILEIKYWNNHWRKLLTHIRPASYL